MTGLLTAIVGVLSAVVGAVSGALGSLFTHKDAASQRDLDTLRELFEETRRTYGERITVLECENERMCTELLVSRAHERILVTHISRGLPPPPPPRPTAAEVISARATPPLA